MAVAIAEAIPLSRVEPSDPRPPDVWPYAIKTILACMTAVIVALISIVWGYLTSSIADVRTDVSSARGEIKVIETQLQDTRIDIHDLKARIDQMVATLNSTHRPVGK